MKVSSRWSETEASKKNSEELWQVFREKTSRHFLHKTALHWANGNWCNFKGKWGSHLILIWSSLFTFYCFFQHFFFENIIILKSIFTLQMYFFTCMCLGLLYSALTFSELFHNWTKTQSVNKLIFIDSHSNNR